MANKLLRKLKFPDINNVYFIPNTNTIIPEMYGAVGDGVTDDTNALQLALNEAAAKRTSITFSGGKKYGISSTLNILRRFPVYGNGATIKALSSMDNMIYVSTERTVEDGASADRKVGGIYDLMLDCDKKAKRGIWCQTGWEYFIERVDILRPTDNGIYLDQGCEWFINGIHVFGYDGIKTSACGIYCHTTDSHFSDIVTVEMPMGVFLNANNFISRLHSWSTVGYILESSVMLTVGQGAVFASGCYNDGCATAFKVQSNGSLQVNGLEILIVPESVHGEKERVLFELDSSNQVGNITGSGIFFDYSGVPVKFSNLAQSAWDNVNFDWLGNNPNSFAQLVNHPV